MLHTGAIVAPNFTEFGFGLARAPEGLMKDLKQAVHDGLPDAVEETKIDVISGQRPKFIKRPELTRRVLLEMLPYAEEWTTNKIQLKPHVAYGFP